MASTSLARDPPWEDVARAGARFNIVADLDRWFQPRRFIIDESYGRHFDVAGLAIDGREQIAGAGLPGGFEPLPALVFSPLAFVADSLAFDVGRKEIVLTVINKTKVRRPFLAELFGRVLHDPSRPPS